MSSESDVLLVDVSLPGQRGVVQTTWPSVEREQAGLCVLAPSTSSEPIESVRVVVTEAADTSSAGSGVEPYVPLENLVFTSPLPPISPFDTAGLRPAVPSDLGDYDAIFNVSDSDTDSEMEEEETREKEKEKSLERLSSAESVDSIRRRADQEIINHCKKESASTVSTLTDTVSTVSSEEMYAGTGHDDFVLVRKMTKPELTMTTIQEEEKKTAPDNRKTVEKEISVMSVDSTPKPKACALPSCAEMDKAFEQRGRKPGDLIFDIFKEAGGSEASLSRLMRVLRSMGIREKDPRIRKVVEQMKEMEQDDDNDSSNLVCGREKFIEVIKPSIPLIAQALRGHFIIPSWSEFTQAITDVYNDVSKITIGEVATYIPQLARQNPKHWGMSICTIDGQRFSLGDVRENFCIQSVSKAFNYAIVASDLGTDKVHSYVGHEPSGRLFNEICLDGSGKPHNPLINAGAIITTSLIKSGESMADRYDFVLSRYKRLAGGEHVGFNNATFLSERDSADRNYALSYYMKENKCFPSTIKSLREELDLYFQLCSLEMNTDSLSVMAATLANGGVCPLTEERCISPQPCRDVLSLMYSCGMYDYSGKFAFQVGLPAKSGVSGAMIVVIPNLMGICLFAPPIDKMGNSCKGVAFCQKLIEKFNFHNYDSLLHADTKKMDPRRRIGARDTELVVSLLYAAKYGDMESVRRMYLQGQDLNMADYDGRTALHVSASEGHYSIVKFLLNNAGVQPKPKDRWGRTPLDDAKMFKHEICARMLSHPKFQNQLADAVEESDEYESDESTESARESADSSPNPVDYASRLSATGAFSYSLDSRLVRPVSGGMNKWAPLSDI